MRLGETLIERKLLDPDDLERALELQKERGDKLGKILVDLGLHRPRDVLAALSEQLGVPLVTVDEPPPAAPEIERSRRASCASSAACPFASTIHTLTLAMADPLDFETISAVRGFSGLKVAHRARARAGDSRRHRQVLRRNAKADRWKPKSDGAGAGEDLEHLRDMASEAPVIRLVNAMIAQAVEKRASDIHIEPFEKEFRIRYPRRRRAVQSGAAAARDEGGDHFAPEADGQAEYRRAPSAAGRPHQDQDAGPRSRSARLDAADAVWRKRRHAPARPLGGRFLRSAAAGIRRPHAARAWSITRRCRTAFFW